MTLLKRNALHLVPADIPGALDELGIRYKIAGDEAVALCPSPDHDDRKPSWGCNIRTGLHWCFSCGFGGSFARLVRAVRGGSTGEAELWIRAYYARNWTGEVPDDDEEPDPVLRVSEADLWECVTPPAGALAARMVSRAAALQMEVLWNPRKTCWVFPMRDPETGRLAGWQEKRGKYVRNCPDGAPRNLAVFGLGLLRYSDGEDDAIVTESPLNAARFLTAGIPGAVATFGIEFSDDQIAAIRKYSRGIIFAQDNDLAGQRKISRWLARHPAERASCRVFGYDVFEDREQACWVHRAGDGRDPGNLSDAELALGIRDATPAHSTYFEAVDWKAKS